VSVRLGEGPQIEVGLAGEELSRDVELVRRRAADLAARLSSVARASASIAQERAVLRMLGVDGLDRAGRPLASAVSDRYCSELERLAGGVLLPLTVAMLEYDLPARETALEVASGAIDLRLEAELLERPDRLMRAEQRAQSLLGSAIARIDANRTATREMRDVLGLPPEPRLGVAVRSSEVEAAAAEVRSLVRQGASVVEVRVPAGWELTETWRQAGLDAGGAFGANSFGAGGAFGQGPGVAVRGPDTAGGRAMRGLATVGRVAAERARLRALRTGSSAATTSAPAIGVEAPVPAGSQRGLARLRKAADEASAERDCYASLMTVTSALAAPEQAIVAAFERIDIVESDAIREIVEDNVDPERALADHSFAHRIEARAGSHLLLGAGPLALGPDVAAGVPSDGLARAGRALALQALGVELALADGLAPERILISCVPSWIVAERDASQAPLQALVRRRVFPDHQLVIVGPAVGLTTPSAGAALSAALTAAPTAVVLDRAIRDVTAAASDLESIAAGAAAARGDLLGDAVLPRAGAGGRAERILEEAAATLERLESEGWTSVLGPTSDRDNRGRLGRSAVVDRARGSGHSADLVDRFF
jgi:hypothetical protein